MPPQNRICIQYYTRTFRDRNFNNNNIQKVYYDCSPALRRVKKRWHFDRRMQNHVSSQLRLVFASVKTHCMTDIRYKTDIRNTHAFIREYRRYRGWEYKVQKKPKVKYKGFRCRIIVKFNCVFIKSCIYLIPQWYIYVST